MSIETANGNGDKIQGAFSLGLITSKFNIGGPLDRKKKMELFKYYPAAIPFRMR
jgi:hypothetical protein